MILVQAFDGFMMILVGSPPGPKFMSYIKDIFKQAHVPVHFEEILYTDSDNPKGTEEFAHLALLSMHRNGVGIKVSNRNFKSYHFWQ